MKFVAAARLRRAQEAALAARPYARELARMLRSIMARIEEPQHPLLARRTEQNVLVLVLSGERGLAGAFNTNILKKAHEFFRTNKDKKMVTIPVGKKGRDALKKAGFTFAGEYINVLTRVDFATAREIANLVTALYAKEEVDAVYIVFSEFKTVMTANLVVDKLLPVESIEETAEGATAKGETPVDYLYEQPKEQLLDKLLPRYVEATKNAGDVIEALTLHMNKVRQAAITKEIIEIVSGASSTA
jgi:F-type H+-transporting ATPase subunit gamma